MTSLDGLLHNSQVVNIVLRGVTTAEATYFEHFGFTNQLRRDGSRKGLSNKVLQTRYRYIYIFFFTQKLTHCKIGVSHWLLCVLVIHWLPMHLTPLLLPNGEKKKSPLINLCRPSTPEHLILNHLCRGTKAIENAASWMKEVPIHNWNSKCSLCSDLRFYRAHGDACVVCGYMPSLQLGWGVWKWSQLLANVLTQILSLVGLRGTENVK